MSHNLIYLIFLLEILHKLCTATNCHYFIYYLKRITNILRTRRNIHRGAKQPTDPAH